MAADYYAILKNAIGALPESSGEARRAVYEKARRAVVDQLKSFDPPLSATEITQERLRLEDCIRRVEAEAAKGILTQTLSRTGGQQQPPAPPPREEPRTRMAYEPPQRPSLPPPSQPQSGYGQQPAYAPPSDRTPTRGYAPLQEPPTGYGQDRGLDRGADRYSDRSRERVPGSNSVMGPAPTPASAYDTRPVERTRLPQTNGFQPQTTGFVPPPQHNEPQTGPGGYALRQAVQEAEQLGAAVAETAQNAREALLASHHDPYAEEQARRAQAEQAAPPQAEEAFGAERRSKKPMIAALTVGLLVVGVGAAALWSQSDRIASYLGVPKPFASNGGKGGDKNQPKSIDRIPTDDAGQPKDVVKVPTEKINVPQEGTPAPASATGQKAAVDAPPILPPVNQPPKDGAPQTAQAPGPQTAPAPQAPLPQQPVPMVAQKVTMMEEGAAGAQPQYSTGKVVWQLVKESPSAGKPPVSILRARVEIPDRRMTMTLSMQPNSDPTFSASHLIEVRFSLPPDFDAKGVSNVPGLIVKPNEQSNGQALVAASAKISSGFFWIALSSSEGDKQKNLALLKDGGWLSVPIVYETGKRGLITIEKAGAGDKVFADALSAWQQ
jgi:hypothetical protein